MTIRNLPLQWQEDRTFLVPGHGLVDDKLDLLDTATRSPWFATAFRTSWTKGRRSRRSKPPIHARIPQPVRHRHGPVDDGQFVETIYKELAAK